jgi:hypothetical protein
MDRVVCPTCGEEHDLSEMEPTYRWPDAYLAVPKDERARRTMAEKDDCRIRDSEGSNEQFFLRVLMPIPVRGERVPCSWGVWVEINGTAYARASELWNDPNQDRESPFLGKLANSLKGFDCALGLPGMVQLTGPTSIPTFTLAASVQHPLGVAQREGVYPERVLEWLSQHCHD